MTCRNSDEKNNEELFRNKKGFNLNNTVMKYFEFSLNRGILTSWINILDFYPETLTETQAIIRNNVFYFKCKGKLS